VYEVISWNRRYLGTTGKKICIPACSILQVIKVAIKKINSPRTISRVSDDSEGDEVVDRNLFLVKG
jgi:hypothetical protein